MSDMSMKPSELAVALNYMINIKRPVFTWGAPGIGKSDIVRQIAEESGRKLIDIRLLLMESTDLRGIPYLDRETKRQAWGAPSDLPTDKDDRSIILLDEMNAAPPAVQAAAYQLVLDRKIGQYKLPDGCAILAAGNRQNDRGVTYQMPSPLSNRFVHLELRVDSDDWELWALKNMISPDVISYLKFSPQHLHDHKPKQNERSFPTPRSWSFVSQLLGGANGEQVNLPDSILQDLTCGSIGEGVGRQFISFRRNNQDLPNPMDILLGKVKKLKNKTVSAQYALATNMTYKLKQKSDDVARGDLKQDEWFSMANNFLDFMSSETEAEMVIMSVHKCMKIHKMKFNSAKMAAFSGFFKKYGRFLTELD